MGQKPCNGHFNHFVQRECQGWDLKEQKDKVKDTVTLGDRTTCLGVLQKQLGAEAQGDQTAFAATSG